MTDGEVCIANIGPAGRRRRARFGYVWFAITLIAAVFLFWTGAPRLTRLGLLVPAIIGGEGVFQARGHT